MKEEKHFGKYQIKIDVQVVIGRLNISHIPPNEVIAVTVAGCPDGWHGYISYNPLALPLIDVGEQPNAALHAMQQLNHQHEMECSPHHIPMMASRSWRGGSRIDSGNESKLLLKILGNKLGGGYRFLTKMGPNGK